MGHRTADERQPRKNHRLEGNGNGSLARITVWRATADKGSPIALACLTNQSDATSQNIRTVSHVQAQRFAKGLDPKASADHPRNVPDQAHARLANLVSAYAANGEITLVGGGRLVVGAFCAIAWALG